MILVPLEEAVRVRESERTRGRRRVGGSAVAAVLAVVVVVVTGAIVTSDHGGAAPDVVQASPAGATAVPQVPRGVAASIVEPGTDHWTPVPDQLAALQLSGVFQMSPDGTRAVFVAPGPGDEAGSQLFVASADGVKIRQLTFGGMPPGEPAWSPSGSQVVFVRNDAVGGRNLFVVDLRSRHVHQVTHGRVDGWLVEPTPNFSADGRRILFTATGGDGSWIGLWIVPVSGGRATLLMRDAAYGILSPDGATIAYHTTGHRVDAYVWPMDVGIWLADADGGNRRPLIESGHTMAPVDWSNTRPAWSPDGTRIALALAPQSSGPIVVLEADARYHRSIGAADDGWIPHLEYAGRGVMPTWLDVDALFVEEVGSAKESIAWSPPRTTVVGRRSS